MKFYYKEIVLEIPDSVYYPREDSLLLAKILEKEPLKGRYLDMGCGSGFLAILMAKSADVTAVDINKEAIKATKENAEKNNVKIKAFVSDLFSFVDESFDLIVFNPPYLPTKDESEQWSGGKSGREVIEKFVHQAGNHLEKNGKILLLISSLTGEKVVLDLFSNNGFSASIIARKKVPWEELMVIEALAL